MHQVSLLFFLFFYAILLIWSAPCFWCYTVQALMKPLWGVFWLPQWDSCTHTKYPFIHSPCPNIHPWYPPPMPRIISVWQICDGLSRVLFTLYLSQKLCVGMTRCAGRCTGQSTCLRYQEGCHLAMLQNSSILFGVGSSFFFSFALVEQAHHH